MPCDRKSSQGISLFRILWVSIIMAIKWDGLRPLFSIYLYNREISGYISIPLMEFFQSYIHTRYLRVLLSQMRRNQYIFSCFVGRGDSFTPNVWDKQTLLYHKTLFMLSPMGYFCHAIQKYPKNRFYLGYLCRKICNQKATACFQNFIAASYSRK